ncbi:MAG: CHAT domain-containing protein [Anaerolineales bacterium]|nr:CHAT domain-containing protein [Anaerolineales bacterium]
MKKLLSIKEPEKQYQLLASWGNTAVSTLSTQWKNEAQQLAFQGRIEEALQIGRLIFSAGRQFENASLSAFGHWTTANVYHIAERDVEALRHFGLAADLYTKLHDELNRARMSVGHIASFNRAFQIEKALRLAQQVKPILSASHDPVDSIQRLSGVLNNEAILYEQLGRYEEAIKRYHEKIRLWSAWPDQPDKQIQIARTFNNIGYTKMLLNLFSEASFAFDQACRILSQPPLADKHPIDLLRVKVNQARLSAYRQANAEDVMTAYAEAETMRLAIQNDDVHGYQLVGHLPLFMAEWKMSKGLLTLADVQQIEHLQTVYTTANQRWEAGRATLLSAKYALENGRIQKALTQTNNLRQTVANQGEWSLLYETWLLIGQIHTQAGAVHSAVQAWETAVTLLETIGGQIRAGDLRSGFLEGKQSPYLSLAHHFLMQEAWATAFHWLERKRARTLLETFAGNQPIYPESAKPLIAQLEKIQQQRNELSDNAAHAQLDNRILDISRQLSDLLDPGYRWLTGETVSEETIAAALHEQALMLIYVNVQDHLWVLPVTNRGILPARSLGLPIPEVAIDHAIRWIEGTGHTPPAKFDKWVNHMMLSVQPSLQAWYKQLIMPVADLLSTTMELIVVPDGTLHQIPFHALLNDSTGRYLVEETAVSYAHSASAWTAGQQKRPSDTGSLLLAFNSDQLQHTAAVANAVKAAHPDCVVYTEAEATRDKITTIQAQQAHLIHFACHAEFRADSPQFSYLQLADGRFEAIDLLWRSLSAELVTLSACETGKGFFHGGEYWGLARAFLLAGARSVLATHWLVEDVETPLFMKIFYAEWQKGISIRQALRQAQLAFIQSDSRLKHPYFWAPFFTIGAEPLSADFAISDSHFHEFSKFPNEMPQKQ